MRVLLAGIAPAPSRAPWFAHWRVLPRTVVPPLEADGTVEREPFDGNHDSETRDL